MAFVNYAHRGASEYLPENTMLAFYTGIYMGANGIETDVQRCKDGTLVLFHDDTLLRVTGEKGSVEDYTFQELQNFSVKKNGFTDKIVAFEDFLSHFAHRDITFAIELKGKGVEEDTARLLRKYDMAKKTVVTSFQLDYLRNFQAVAPEFAIGYLTRDTRRETLEMLRQMGATEYCPEAETMTPELTETCHAMGLGVRAWGVYNEELMAHAVRCGADGMTVNFPDKLTAYLKK
jgi:glycerophosphoryl diester phosphodiesterase